MPLSGYLGSVLSGYPIKWFGVGLPAWGWSDPAIKDLMSNVHLVASWTLLASTALHVAGTIKHALAGDRVMARMSLPPPRGRSSRGTDPVPSSRG